MELKLRLLHVTKGAYPTRQKTNNTTTDLLLQLPLKGNSGIQVPATTQQVCTMLSTDSQFLGQATATHTHTTIPDSDQV